ncbi:class I tRNA ligase family protein [Natronoglycomyces albus]|uniref:Methionyl-tRNA synthetase n=1 Tax=Natronoglycomyces albus TaxID=2811108 RepID=A0A895XWI0_9ACTN|nr:class I tRNA ligase family protein [Natronoglycomyces albus]QSB06876.1 class I tRNA ligase family protein [Natronoglycomyces albus]
MILDYYDEGRLSEAFGIDMTSVDGLDVGAGWGRVAPGVTSTSHQHDETEFFVIVAGHGELSVDGRIYRAVPGTVALFEPFESHTITNTGESDLVFFTQYWRGERRAAASATSRSRPHPVGRPQFVFSTPPTPNGDLHLGHLSGPYLGADVYVRYQRRRGHDAWHLTGSDDFQSYVAALAQREGKTPEEVAAHYSEQIAQTLALMDINVDHYTVTSPDERYQEGLRDFFDRLTASGSVRVGEAPALVDENGAYLYEVDVSGRCPGCDTGTSGNICEECGEPNVVTDLVEPTARGGAAQPRREAVKRYLLPLHRFADTVEGHHRLGRVPARLRELAARVFARREYELPVSHPSQWGVEPRRSQAPGNVVWVWPEMSYGFLYGIERLGERLGHQWKASTPEREWKIVHFFGYDNSFYHSLLYPVLYRLAFPEWNPDIDYHLNEFYLLDGEKFSTSRRHVIWGRDILNPDTVDAVRYYLSLTRPELERTDFRRADFERVVDEELRGQWATWLNDLGTRVRQGYGSVPDAGTWTTEHVAFLARLSQHLDAITASLNPEAFSLRQSARLLSELVGAVRDFSAAQSRLAGLAAWESESRTAIALELAAARLLAATAAPVMPRFSGALFDALGLEDTQVWPETVSLVPPGTVCSLEATRFFAASDSTATEPSPVESWLRARLRAVAQLDDSIDLAGRSPVSVGLTSLGATAVQYQLLDELGADVALELLLGDQTTRQIAQTVEKLADPARLAALKEDR